MKTRVTDDHIVIQRMQPQEWRQLREVRLRALQCEPNAFGTAREHDLVWSANDWRGTLTTNAWLRASAVGQSARGIVAYFPTDTDPDGAPQLGSMWVDPQLRRAGLGRQLFAAVAQLARDEGARMLGLWVVDGNEVAANTYRRLGFRASGDRKPAPRDPQVVMHRMLLPL